MPESRFKVGDEAIALSGPFKKYPSGRLVFITDILDDPDGKVWIRAWWPAVSTDEEFETNRKLEANGLKVDYVVWNHGIVEGPEEKFL